MFKKAMFQAGLFSINIVVQKGRTVQYYSKKYLLCTKLANKRNFSLISFMTYLNKSLVRRRAEK